VPSPDAPTVSVDQALWYHVSDLEFDVDAIAEFYDQLDLPAKPPLQDRRIHLSSLAYFWPVKESLGSAWCCRPPRGCWARIRSGRPAAPLPRGSGFGSAEEAADAKAERAALMEIGRKILELARTRDQFGKVPGGDDAGYLPLVVCARRLARNDDGPISGCFGQAG
jgi:hypothetical protein